MLMYSPIEDLLITKRKGGGRVGSIVLLMWRNGVGSRWEEKWEKEKLRLGKRFLKANSLPHTLFSTELVEWKEKELTKDA